MLKKFQGVLNIMKKFTVKTARQSVNTVVIDRSPPLPIMAIKTCRWRLKCIQAKRRKQQLLKPEYNYINFADYIKSINTI